MPSKSTSDKAESAGYVVEFVLHSLEELGRNPADKHLREPLLRGLAFLLALQGPDGIKCGLVEAKPWYWGATYEVASHPFDVAALALRWRHWGPPPPLPNRTPKHGLARIQD